MTLWFGLALMTAVAVLAVLWPLARRTGNLRSGSDVAVYRDQLEEIERDRASGVIPDQEAASAQVEPQRHALKSIRSKSMFRRRRGRRTNLFVNRGRPARFTP